MEPTIEPIRTRAKAWLVTNNTAVMAVLLVVFGIRLPGNGIQILAA